MVDATAPRTPFADLPSNALLGGMPGGGKGSTLCELAALDRTRPGLHASRDELVAWLEAKATTHDHLAAEAAACDDMIGKLCASGHAAVARSHAARLRVEGVLAA